MTTTLEDFEQYLREERMRRPRTIAHYLMVLRSLVAFLKRHKGAKVDLSQISKQVLVEFLRHQARGSGEPSRSTWNSRLTALRAFYDYLLKQEVIDMNPALKIDRQKVFTREPTPLSFDEMLRLVEAIEEKAPSAYKHRNVAIVQVLLHCALRVTEVASLNFSQVDFDNYLFLNVRVKGGKQFSVVFNDVVAEALENYLKDRSNLLAGKEEEALFVSDRRRRIGVRSIQGMVKRYAELANISRPVSPHLLRHSSATELVEMGTPLSVVQEICGHVSVTTTQRYVHVSGGQRRRAVDALGAKWRAKAQERKVRPSGKADSNPDSA